MEAQDNWLMFINKKYLFIYKRAYRHAYKPVSCKCRSKKVQERRHWKAIALAQSWPRREHAVITVNFSKFNNPEDWSTTSEAGAIEI